MLTVTKKVLSELGHPVLEIRTIREVLFKNHSDC